MTLRKLWEYNIYAEWYNEKDMTSNYKGWNILCEESPATGWSKVFTALQQEPEFPLIRKLQNASCMQKEFLETT